MPAKKRPAVNTAKKQGGRGKPFQPGQSGNPAGRPKGSRNKLGEDVLGDFCALWDFARLQKLAVKNPALFVKLAVSLIPKQVELEAKQAVYVIGDRPLSADEWAAGYAKEDSGVESAGRAARGSDKVPAAGSVLRRGKGRRKD